MKRNVSPESIVDLQVRRDRWSECRVTSTPLPDSLDPGQVLLRIDRFALTSNNISYALTGKLLGYWQFFPAPEPWGRLPVMGFADVVESARPEIAIGERVFGFFPIATHLVVEAADVEVRQFCDGAPHRAATALAYRQYLRSDADPQYAVEREDELLLLRGLFLTSFLVDDFLADQAEFGARSFVISSASSKTALALAFLLSRRRAGRVIGLTSQRNRSFVEGLQCHDQVLTYDSVAELPASEATVFVDHAGNGAVVDAIHRHFAENLRHSAVVGATHWDGGRPSRSLPGPIPTFFFAPAQMEKRLAEWGAVGFQDRLGDAWQAFLAFTDRWLRVVRGGGPEAVERVYREVLEGRARPEQGHVLSMFPGAS